MAAASSGVSPQTIAFLESVGRTNFAQNIPNADRSVNTTAAGSAAAPAGSIWDNIKNAGSGFLDLLSRPLYATAGFTKQELINQSDPTHAQDALGAALQGLEGKTKDTFGNVIQTGADLRDQAAKTGSAVGWQPNQAQVNPWVKGVAGFAGDIAFDPLTYVGGGLIKDAVQAPFKIAKAFKGSTNLIDGATTAIDEAKLAADNLKATEAITGPGSATSYSTVQPPVKPSLTDTLANTDSVLKDLSLPKPPAVVITPSRELPSALAGAKPGYSYGAKRFVPSFTDGVHKALYVVAGKGKSAQHDSYMSFLRGHFPGETDRQIVNRGLQVRSALKEKAAVLPHGADLALGDHPAAFNIEPKTPDIVHAAAVDPKVAETVVSHNLKPSNIVKEPLTPQEAQTVGATAEKYLTETNRASYLKSGKVPEGTGSPHFNLAKQLNAVAYAVKHHVETHGIPGAKIDKGLQVSAKHPWFKAKKNALGAKLLPHIEDTMTALGKPPVGFGRLKNPDVVRLSDLLSTTPVPKGMTLQHHLGNLVKEYNGPIENMSPGIRAIHDASQNAADVIENAHATAAARNAAVLVGEAGSSADKAQAAIDATKEAAKEGAVTEAAVKTATESARDIPFTVQVIKGGPPKVKALVGGAAKYDGPTTAAVHTLFDDARRLDMGAITARSDNWWNTSFMGKFIDNSAGKRFLHNSYQTLNAGAKSAMSERMGALVQAVEGLNQQQIRQAFKAVQSGLTDSAASPEMLQATQALKNYISELFGTHGLALAAMENTTDVTRAGLTMRMLNDSMRRSSSGKYAFSNSAKLEGPLGITDHSKNLDWMHSWRNMDIQDPIDFLAHANSAIVRSTHENMYFNALQKLEGVVVSEHSVPGKITAPHPLGYTDNMHFPPALGREVQRAIYTLQNDFKLGGKGWQQYDKVMRLWKAGNTIVNPVHHIHNLEGDMYLAYLDGVKTPGPYFRMFDYFRSRPDIYTDIKPSFGSTKGIDLSTLAGPGGIDKIMAKGASDGKHIVTANIAGKQVKIDAAQFHVLVNQHGIFPRFSVVEDLPDMANETIKAQGGFMHGITKLSETREHFVRGAHAIDIMGKGKWDSIDHMMNETAARVRKYHPSGEDLTQSERAVMRRIMPFYSWTRKAIPLVLESMVMRPNRFLNPFIASHELALANGVQQPGVGNQFPVDQLFPDWMRQGVIGPQFGSAGHYMLANPSLPNSSVLNQLTDPVGGIASMLTPAITLPGQAISRTNWQTGAPIKDAGAFINNQIPTVSQFDRVTNTNLGPGNLIGSDIQTPQQQANQSPWTGFLNWFTGAGLTDTSRFIKSATKEQQYKQKQAAKTAALTKKGP